MPPNRIQEFRKARNLSADELADRTELSPSYISLMERGKRNVSLKNLQKLANALQCSPQELIGTHQGEATPGEFAIDPLLLAAWKLLDRKSRKQLVQFALIMAGSE